jgi:BirA family transcriptional regulator, biotin operon repressor / biotin---[acetyl-CoA-carboxylase] ligase
MGRRDEILAGGARLVVRDLIDSTNAEALRQARAGERGPLWVVAEEQTAGRGRRGRAWTSPRGNLYATLLLTEACAPERAPQLSFVAALALHDALCGLAPPVRTKLQVKWPNDLVLGGAKVAGILVEGESAPGRSFAVAIGMGVNCVSHPADTLYPATDLRVSGVETTAEALLPLLARSMRARLDRWAGGAGFDTIREDWTLRAARLGERIRLRVGERQAAGRLMGIDEDGRLVLETDEGEREAFSAGEVTTGMATLERLRAGAAV